MDEPSANLDMAATRELAGMLSALKARGKPSLLPSTGCITSCRWRTGLSTWPVDRLPQNGPGPDCLP